MMTKPDNCSRSADELERNIRKISKTHTKLYLIFLRPSLRFLQTISDQLLDCVLCYVRLTSSLKQCE